jgi:hypothetical protein
LIDIDKNFLFRGGSIGRLFLLVKGYFAAVLHRKTGAGELFQLQGRGDPEHAVVAVETAVRHQDVAVSKGRPRSSWYFTISL